MAEQDEGKLSRLYLPKQYGPCEAEMQATPSPRSGLAGYQAPRGGGARRRQGFPTARTVLPVKGAV